jgi:hypothetical protein
VESRAEEDCDRKMKQTHPYKSQPEKAFWSRAVAQNYQADALVESLFPILRANDTVASAGSCFASNIVKPIEAVGYEYVRTEELPFPLNQLPENLGYRNFSAAYGNIYTARQFRQLLERAEGIFQPTENYWLMGEDFVDPFRPGLRYPAKSLGEYETIQRQHLSSTKQAFTSADVTVFTLGLTEAWESIEDGAVYPTCPGTVNGVYDDRKYQFINFSVNEVAEDMVCAFSIIKSWNPDARFILTVSPVPLVATATSEHVVTATILSKSILRVAASEVCKTMSEVKYFPAYEIVTGPQAPENSFEENRRDVTASAIENVMRSLINNCELSGNESGVKIEKSKNDATMRSSISRDLMNAECDEVVLEW